MSAPMARGTAALPTAAFLRELTHEQCEDLLRMHAERLQTRFYGKLLSSARLAVTDEEFAAVEREQRLAKRSFRVCKLRLRRRADEFGVVIGKPPLRLRLAEAA